MSDIDSCENKILVVVDGSPGVVSNIGSKLQCCICNTIFCSHCLHMKKLKKDTSQADFVLEFFKETPISKPSTWRHAESWKKIPFDVAVPDTLKPPSTYLLKVGNYYQCEDTNSQCRWCGGLLENAWKKEINLVCKSYLLECEGTNLK